jgi:hypothetical protein
VFQQLCDLLLHLIELVQFQSGINDCEHIPGLGVLVNKDTPPIFNGLTPRLENASALEHHRQDETRANVPRLIQIQKLAQKAFGSFALNRLSGRRRWRCVRAQPMRNKALSLGAAF